MEDKQLQALQEKILKIKQTYGLMAALIVLLHMLFFVLGFAFKIKVFAVLTIMSALSWPKPF